MNEHQRKAQERQELSRQFLRALSAGQVAAIDRFGRKLDAGQKVLFHPPFDLMFDVVSVAPVLDPNQPPGLLAVTLTVTVPVHLRGNVPDPSLVVLMEASSPSAATVAPDEAAGEVPSTEDSPIAPEPPLRPSLVLTDPPQ